MQSLLSGCLAWQRVQQLYQYDIPWQQLYNILTWNTDNVQFFPCQVTSTFLQKINLPCYYGY